MTEKVLLVEDEAGMRVTLGDRLRKEGYTVETAVDGIEGLHKGTDETFDLIILDIMLPQKSGLDVCRDLRQQGITTPVLMLTARGQTLDKVLGLKIGADDYLTKPFEMIELLARVEALLRRPRGSPPPRPVSIEFGDFRADFRRMEVACEGRPLSLSAKEFQLLRYLLEHRGETLSRETLLQEVWGYDKTPNTRTVDVHIAWLRQKLEKDPRNPEWIVTVHGFGYRFAS